MVFNDLLQLISVAVSFFVLGSTVGQFAARRQRQSIDSQSLVGEVLQGLLSITLQSVSCVPLEASEGTRLDIKYAVHSDFRLPVKIWLGANLGQAGTMKHNNINEDRIVTVTRGNNTLQRYLTINRELPAGEYFLSAELWLGPKSMNTESIVLAQISEPICIRLR